MDGEYETLSKFTGTVLAGEALCRVTEASDEISSVLMYNLKTDVPGDYTLKWYFREPFYPEELAELSRTVYSYPESGEILTETQVLWKNK